MNKTTPSQAQVVIIGGGVVGCSVAYHLAKLGMNDVVLLERKVLTSGTTWHAAGLVGQLRATQNMTKLAQYTSELLRDLGKETGQSGETWAKKLARTPALNRTVRFQLLPIRSAMRSYCAGLRWPRFLGLRLKLSQLRKYRKCGR